MDTARDIFQDELAGQIESCPQLRTDRVWRRYLLWKQTRNPALRKSIELRVNMLRGSNAYLAMNDPFHPSPRNELVQNALIELPARIVPTGGRFAISREDIGDHIIVPAANNSGKSNIAKWVAWKLLAAREKKITVWIFTFAKTTDEYHPLTNSGAQILFIDGTELRINPYEPVGPSGPWAMQLSKAHSHWGEYYLGPEGREHSILASVYERLGTDRLGYCPTIFEVMQANREADAPPRTPEFNYQGMLETRYRSIRAGWGKVLLCRKGFPIAQLAKTNMVVGLQSMGRFGEQLAQDLILRLVRHRDVFGLPEDGTENLVILEDAMRVFSRQPEKDSSGPEKGIPIMSEMVFSARARGVHMMVLLQSPSLASLALLGNAGLRFMGRLDDNKSLTDMALSMGCCEPKHFQACRQLKIGQFIVKTRRYPTPFIVEFDRFEAPRP